MGERAIVICAFRCSDEELAEVMAIRGDGATAAPPSCFRNTARRAISMSDKRKQLRSRDCLLLKLFAFQDYF